LLPRDYPDQLIIEPRLPIPKILERDKSRATRRSDRADQEDADDYRTSILQH
jgi:hypothetical protein